MLSSKARKSYKFNGFYCKCSSLVSIPNCLVGLADAEGGAISIIANVFIGFMYRAKEIPFIPFFLEIKTSLIIMRGTLADLLFPRCPSHTRRLRIELC